MVSKTKKRVLSSHFEVIGVFNRFLLLFAIIDRLKSLIKNVNITGVDNYFRPLATLGLYLCLAGQIQVNYTNSKLIYWP